MFQHTARYAPLLAADMANILKATAPVKLPTRHCSVSGISFRHLSSTFITKKYNVVRIENKGAGRPKAHFGHGKYKVVTRVVFHW